MDKSIDKRFITDEFLLEYFPSPDRFHEFTKNPPESSLAVSEERYLTIKNNINKALQGTSIKLADNHLAIIIKNLDGYLVLSKKLKPNKQL